MLISNLELVSYLYYKKDVFLIIYCFFNYYFNFIKLLFTLENEVHLFSLHVNLLLVLCVQKVTNSDAQL